MRLFTYLSIALVLSTILLAVGCGRTDVKTTVAPLRPPKVDSASNSSSVPEVSQEDAQKFADDWVKAIADEDSGAANELIAWREILNVAVEPFSISRREKQGMVDGGLASIAKFSDEISKGANNGGDYQQVQICQRGGESFVLFRLLLAEGELNYHLMRLKMIRARVRADQLFIAASGEEISDTLRNIWAPAIASRGFSGRVSSQQKAYLEALEQQVAMKNAMDLGDNPKAIKIYNQLPASFKTTKTAMLYRVMATSIEDESDYRDAVNEFIEAFPEDAACGLMTIEAGYVRQDTELISKGYRSLDRWTGGDPYLDLMIGANLAVMGSLDQAKSLTESVDPETVGISLAHDYKLTVAIAANDHAETLKQLRILKGDYGNEFLDLRTVDEYSEFVESPAFQQWLSDDQ